MRIKIRREKIQVKKDPKLRNRETVLLPRYSQRIDFIYDENGNLTDYEITYYDF